MSQIKEDLSIYSYELNPISIAKSPASPRDHSKLFIYDIKNDKISFDKFYNVHKYLPKNSFLVLNETKVLPARVFAMDENDQKVELLILINLMNKKDKYIKAIADRKVMEGEILKIGKYRMKAIKTNNKIFLFKPNFIPTQLALILAKHGNTPIPSYIENSPLTEKVLRKKYQTIFAKKEGSVAAPTASLHFTKKVFQNLEKRRIQKLFITLHVGLGTFASLLPENFEKNKLFEERFFIGRNMYKKINQIKKTHKCVAVGTTVVRTLESHSLGMKNKTEIFIKPPFEFKMVDSLITNFHVPKSSLMMLVEAFLQHKKSKKHLKELYEIAIKENFRFYSFGDSMLLI